MERQGGRVQLEKSDMRLALNMAKMAKWGVSRAAIEETQVLVKKPSAEVREEKMRGVEFQWHTNVKAAMERHQAILGETQTDGCLPSHNGTAQNPHTRWRHRDKGAPQQEWLRPQTPEPRPYPPEPPPMPHIANAAAPVSGIKGVPPGYVYILTGVPSAQFFNHDAYAKNRKCDKDPTPDLVTDEGTSTG